MKKEKFYLEAIIWNIAMNVLWIACIVTFNQEISSIKEGLTFGSPISILGSIIIKYNLSPITGFLIITFLCRPIYSIEKSDLKKKIESLLLIISALSMLFFIGYLIYIPYILSKILPEMSQVILWTLTVLSILVFCTAPIFNAMSQESKLKIK